MNINSYQIKFGGNEKMPRGNGMGPNNQGPMTGRAMGYCAGYPTPGFANPNFGSGRGFRRGRGPGRGRGFGRMTMVNPRGLLRPRFWKLAPVEQTQSAQPYQVWEPVEQPQPQMQQPTYQPTKTQETQMLEEEAKAIEQEQKALKEDLEEIRKRLEELRK